MKNFGVVLGLFVLMAWGCGGGGGGGDEPVAGAVNITAALRCSIGMSGGSIGLTEIPANCGVAEIAGDSFETDQSVMHLAGSSFAPANDGCPPSTLGGPVCIPVFPGSNVRWENLRNGISGSGSSGYQVIGFIDPAWFTIFSWPDLAGWSTRNEAYPAGIPLEMGANLIRVSVDDSNTRGSNEITVTRAVDTTPPAVYSVDPEPDGIYGFRVVVYFAEQLAVDSVTNALQVLDSDQQAVSGLSVYNPLKLTLEWRPAQTLNSGAAYSATLTGIEDLAGNAMIDPYAWSFTVN
jgi:hypothetical protein